MTSQNLTPFSNPKYATDFKLSALERALGVSFAESLSALGRAPDVIIIIIYIMPRGHAELNFK